MQNSTTGTCVYCGTERDVAVALCPSCGRGWVDERVSGLDTAAAPDDAKTAGRVLADTVTTTAGDTGSVAAVALEGEDGSGIGTTSTSVADMSSPGDAETQVMDPPGGDGADDGTTFGDDDPGRLASVRWWIPVGIAVAVLVIYGVIFAVLLSRTGEDTAAPVVTTTAATTTTSTEAPTTTVAPSTTTAPTTTTSSTTTTTTLAPIPASGDPVALGDMRLGAAQLGPLAFADPETDAAGVLVSTFGQPDTYFPIGEDYGLCPTETGRAIVWGPLTSIFRTEGDVELLVGYRLETTSTVSHAAEQLRTLSGIGLGDTIVDVNAAYGNVARELVDGEDAFLVLSSGDGRTLVWGLLSGDDPQQVIAISSARACDGGPFAGS